MESAAAISLLIIPRSMSCSTCFSRAERKAVRRLDAVEIFYSFDDKDYVLMRNAWLQDNHPVMVGVMGASPDGNGFKARFENLHIKHLPDARRLQWLKNNPSGGN